MRKKGLFKSLSTKVAAMSVGLLLFVIACAGVLGYFFLRSAYIQNAQDEVMSIAKTVAVNVQGEAYAAMVEQGRPNDYWPELKRYFNDVKESTELKYLYALDNNADGQIQFIVEGQRSDDDPRLICQFGDVLEEGSYTPGLFECLRTGQATVGEVHRVEPFGTMVSGYAPILNAEGQTVGVIGADIGIDRILSKVYSYSLIYVLITSGIALVVGVVLVLYIRRTVGRPIYDIVDAAKKLVKDDFNDIEFDIDPAETSAEMQSLMASFNEVLEKSKRPDYLTRTYSRNAGMRMLKRILEGGRGGASYCVAFADINKLKAINDEYGHNEGDYAIRTVADAMLCCIRDGDMVCRYGGDEFLIIFERCDYRGARAVMDRMKKMLKAVNEQNPKAYDIGFSYGLLEIAPGRFDSTEQVMQALDVLMYDNKRNPSLGGE